jgi:IS30 family transposase
LSFEVQHCYGVVAMGKNYGQHSQTERCMIDGLHSAGLSNSEIARRLGRDRSTIGRELWRNGQARAKKTGSYDAELAHARAASRRRLDHRFKLARQPDLRAYVRDGLAMGWSPQQIGGRLARDGSSMQISAESIYRYCEHRIRTDDYSWQRSLPRHRFKRGWRKKKGGSATKTFKDYVSIEKRPPRIETRKQAGHWEADLMIFSKNKQAILVVAERKSRKLIACRQPGKKACDVRKSLCRQLSPLPQSLRRSITYDNGTEFAEHYLTNQKLGMKSYFCHTHSPWEKGSLENAIGRLRRWLPQGTNLDDLSSKVIQNLVSKYNATPRKCLDYLTPNEAFEKLTKGSTVALQT